jgi:hypothetical protein
VEYTDNAIRRRAIDAKRLPYIAACQPLHFDKDTVSNAGRRRTIAAQKNLRPRAKAFFVPFNREGDDIAILIDCRDLDERDGWDRAIGLHLPAFA